jgi:lipopolysaccharide export system protein LptC
LGRGSLILNRDPDRGVARDLDVMDASAPAGLQRFAFPARERPDARQPGRVRTIRALKVSLTALAAILIALLALWPQLRTSTDRLRIAFADLGVTGDDLSMINARYVGTDSNNRPFSITADAARQSVPGKGKLQLESPQADIHLQDGSWVMVTADKGDYNPDDRMLNVAGAVRLFHDSGYEFLSREANIDLEQSVVWGSQRITGQGPFVEIEGEGFRFSKGGKTLVLTGKSRLKIYPGAFRGPA